MTPWEAVCDYWRCKIGEEFKNQGVDQELLDPLGEGIEMSILPDVLAGATVADAVQDWIEWKRQDIQERKEEDDDLFR